VDAPQATLTT